MGQPANRRERLRSGTSDPSPGGELKVAEQTAAGSPFPYVSRSCLSIPGCGQLGARFSSVAGGSVTPGAASGAGAVEQLS